MFESISWSQYFTTVAIAAVLYYIFIWAFYFKMRMPAFEFIRQGEKTDNTVIEQLRPVFRNRHNKSELVLALQTELRSLADRAPVSDRGPINQFIIQESKDKCSIHLDEGDLREVWKG